MSMQEGRKLENAPAIGTFGQVKSVKVVDMVLVAFGGRPGRDVKLVLKALSKREHYTLVMRVLDPKTLEVDIHLTHEGSTPAHEPIAKVQLDMREWEKITENQVRRVYERAIQKLDLDSPDASFAEAEYLPVRSIFQHGPSKRRIEITKESAEASFDKEIMTLNQFLASREATAVVFRERKRALELAARNGAEAYVINLDRLIGGMMKLMGFDRVVKVISEALERRKVRHMKG
ncbi:MAG: hypothetical protein JRN18_02000 [Nitrososphaerota archaeon]|nr:hypothetical protein [Nitrososphaerota archaeon]MDG6916868.1 hypothetical protein [Nitrososphaerota archaeon]